MNRRLGKALLAAILLALGFWLWTVLFPSPERVIRKRLAEFAKLASFGKEAPLAVVMNSQKLASFLTADVELQIELRDGPRQVFSGREQLVEARRQAPLRYSGLQVEFLDVHVVVGPDRQSAEANLTLKARLAGEKDLIVQELKLLLNKAEGSWKIKRIETVKTLSAAPHNHSRMLAFL